MIQDITTGAARAELSLHTSMLQRVFAAVDQTPSSAAQVGSRCDLSRKETGSASPA